MEFRCCFIRLTLSRSISSSPRLFFVFFEVVNFPFWSRDKVPGSDNLQPQILRELSCQIAPVLCNIFKVSLRTSTASPDDWKLANVTPLHKKGSKQLPEDYRTVSLTCVCCKLMEHFLVSHISKYSLSLRYFK